MTVAKQSRADAAKEAEHAALLARIAAIDNPYYIYVGLYRDGFAVFAVRKSDDRVVSRCWGSQTLARAEQVAHDYHFSFGRAPIVYSPELV